MYLSSIADSISVNAAANLYFIIYLLLPPSVRKKNTKFTATISRKLLFLCFSCQFNLFTRVNTGNSLNLHKTGITDTSSHPDVTLGCAPSYLPPPIAFALPASNYSITFARIPGSILFVSSSAT